MKVVFVAVMAYVALLAVPAGDVAAQSRVPAGDCRYIEGGSEMICFEQARNANGQVVPVKRRIPFQCVIQGGQSLNYHTCRMYGLGIMADIVFQTTVPEERDSAIIRFEAFKPDAEAFAAVPMESQYDEMFRLEFLKLLRRTEEEVRKVSR